MSKPARASARITEPAPPIPDSERPKSEAAAEWVATAALTPWVQNPRKNDPAVARVVASIQRFGFGAPILARRADGEVIAGHTRLKAALALGLDRVPVRYLDLDPADAHLLALADNKLGELAGWDEPQLLALLGDLRQQDADAAAVAGWGDAEIDALLKAAGDAVLADGAPTPAVTEDDVPVDRADELRTKWATAAGQLWEIPSARGRGMHRLLCGDSTRPEDVGRVMGRDRAAWMWTDPPYGVSYVGKTKAALTIQNDGAGDLPAFVGAAFAAADAVLVDGAPVYVAHPAGALCVEFGKAFLAAGWHFHETLVWVKDAMVLGHSDYHFQHEPIIYGWKGKNRPWFGGRDKVSLLRHPKPNRSESHPTMKPVGLVAECLANSSAPAAVGFEPFSGSGTTLVAAEQLGRLCRAVELEPKYVAVALERLAALGLTPRLATHSDGPADQAHA
jgi:DNA modification methylase